MSNLDKVSRKLTQILRHKIIDYNLEVTNQGYVKIDDIFNLTISADGNDSPNILSTSLAGISLI